LADAKAEQLVMKMLDDVREVMNRVVDKMPTHEEFIAKHCKAPALPM
jgi:hypothetical protein